MTSDRMWMAACLSHSPLMQTADAGDRGQRFRAAVVELRRAVEEFHPELVVFFGPDHSRALTDVVPAFTVVAEASGYGDWGTPNGRYDIPSGIAKAVATALLEAHFDVAVAHGLRLDHGFGQAFAQLFGSLDAVPSIPIAINCNRPPLAPMGRVEGFGREVGVALRSWDMRVLFIGSGGLSHSPPLSTDVMRLAEAQRASEMQRLLDGAAKLIQPEWDHRFLDLLEHGDWDTLASMAEEAVLEGGTGAPEVRTWLAACAAVGVPPKRLIYEPIPEWITGMAIVATS